MEHSEVPFKIVAITPNCVNNLKAPKFEYPISLTFLITCLKRILNQHFDDT